MSFKISIPELLKQENECIMVPCVYDCISARAVELSGYKAMLLSGGELAETSGGTWETMLNDEDLVRATERICYFSSLPMIIDTGCMNINTMSVYRTCQRLSNVGAAAILLEDEGMDMSRSHYIANVKACLDAIKGTDCILIARSNIKGETPEEIDEVVARLSEAVELGADMTMACMLNNLEKSKMIAERVPGDKIYPDLNTHDGKLDVVNSDIYPLGYKMASFHYTAKVAMAAMIDAGIKNLENKSNKYSNDIPFYNGVTGHSALPMFNIQEDLYDKEAEFTGVRKIFKVPGEKDK